MTDGAHDDDEAVTSIEQVEEDLRDGCIAFWDEPHVRFLLAEVKRLREENAALVAEIKPLAVFAAVRGVGRLTTEEKKSKG